MKQYTNKEMDEMHKRMMAKNYKYFGQKCKIIDLRETTAMNEFMLIELDDGKKGWVQAQKVILDEE